MEIAITAPSGNVGRFVVGHLVRAGLRPRLLSRHPERARAGWGDLVDARAVDLRDASAVTEATRGVDALFLIVPPGEGDDPVAAYARTGEAVAAAVAANRVPLLFELDAIRAGAVAVLRPTDEPFPWVAPADIAAVAASLLLRTDWSGRRVQAVHGPQDLSWDDALAVVSDVLGRTVTAHRVGDDAMRATLESIGMSKERVEAIVGMSTGLREGFVPEQPRTPVTTTGTTLGAWSWAELRPALTAA